MLRLQRPYYSMHFVTPVLFSCLFTSVFFFFLAFSLTLREPSARKISILHYALGSAEVKKCKLSVNYEVFQDANISKYVYFQQRGQLLFNH